MPPTPARAARPSAAPDDVHAALCAEFTEKERMDLTLAMR
jgi:hypothetical protein